MKIFEKIKQNNGDRQINILGKKIIKYNKYNNLLLNIFSIRTKNDWTCTYKYMTILGFKFIIWPRYMILYAKRFKREFSLKEKKYIIEYQFKRRTGYKPNIDNPKTFNEKLQWLKLYDHNPLMTICADKYKVRDYVEEKIGAEYLIPLLGVWDSPDEIDFDKLPDKFVLKTNWGSGNNLIVTDKSKLNIEDVKAIFKKWLNIKKNHYYLSFEWSYKNIEPKIIAEEYIEQLDGKLLDWKFFCFNGNAHFVQIDIDRATNHKRCFYDMTYNKQPFTTKYPYYEKEIVKAPNFDLMKQKAEELSKGFSHVRIDLYNIDAQIKFGEMTFYHGNGMEQFIPQEWDGKLGDLIKLPTKNN